MIHTFIHHNAFQQATSSTVSGRGLKTQYRDTNVGCTIVGSNARKGVSGTYTDIRAVSLSRYLSFGGDPVANKWPELMRLRESTHLHPQDDGT
jgi:hypothetical protein